MQANPVSHFSRECFFFHLIDKTSFCLFRLLSVRPSVCLSFSISFFCLFFGNSNFSTFLLFFSINGSPLSVGIHTYLFIFLSLFLSVCLSVSFWLPTLSFLLFLFLSLSFSPSFPLPNSELSLFIAGVGMLIFPTVRHRYWNFFFFFELNWIVLSNENTDTEHWGE